MDHTQRQKFSFGARLRSFRYAFRGIGMLVRGEHNAWIHLGVTVLVVLAGLYFWLSWVEWAMIIFAIGFVLSAEAVNSAAERLADRVTVRQDPMIRDAKDLAAGAVLIAAITAVLIGLIIFIPRFYTLF